MEILIIAVVVMGVCKLWYNSDMKRRKKEFYDRPHNRRMIKWV